jgi:hypothetical protein
MSVASNGFAGVSAVSVASFLRKNSAFTSVGLLNIRSLVKHSDELRHLLSGGGFSLFAVTETWMKSNTTIKSVAVPGYNLLWNNRPKRRGGGVGLFIRKEYSASIIDKSVYDSKVSPQLEYLLSSSQCQCWQND